MDTRVRSIVKAVSWQALGLLVTTLIGYAFTGELAQAGAFAAVLTLVSLVTYVLHERIWNAVRWGRSVLPGAAAAGPRGRPGGS